jgi:hypothetical protein
MIEEALRLHASVRKHRLAPEHFEILRNDPAHDSILRSKRNETQPAVFDLFVSSFCLQTFIGMAAHFLLLLQIRGYRSELSRRRLDVFKVWGAHCLPAVRGRRRVLVIATRDSELCSPTCWP